MERRVCRGGRKARSRSGERGSGSAETARVVRSGRCWCGRDTRGQVPGVTGDVGPCVPHREPRLRVADRCPQLEVSPPNTPKVPSPAAGVGAQPREGLTATVLHKRGGAAGRKCVSGTGWDRVAPAAGPRAATDRAPAAAEPGGRTGPRCHLCKGRPVAAGRALGKKYLEWEESKHRGRDILIAGCGL